MSEFCGTIISFDRDVGLGVVRRNDGVEFGFHCIEIADGTRDIPVDAHVTFGLLCKLGCYEARQVART